jgi:RNA polymerase sigma-70 factor (ECF subfamily)
MTPTPVVALNRAIAVAELRGPDAGLLLLDGVDLPGYHLLPATRGELLVRLGRYDEARTAFDEAISLAANRPERALLEGRRDALPT